METSQISEKAKQRLLSLEHGAFVSACYRLLLRREPDPAGLQSYRTELRNGASKSRILETFLDSDEFRLNSAQDSAAISVFLEEAGTVDFTERDFLNRVAAAVKRDCMNLLPAANAE
jgi:hypothetical protein